MCLYCMYCMYCMYLPVLYVLILYLLLLQRQAQESPQRPLMTVSCGGTRQASLRAPQVMDANTFFLHSCPLRQPDFAHPPPLLPRRRSLNRPLPHGWIRNQARSELVDPVPSPVPAYWEVSSLPETYSVCHSPPKTPPDRDWRMHVCDCMCMYCMY